MPWWCVDCHDRALQRQLYRPRPAAPGDRAEGSIGREPSFAILGGRSNYLCLNKFTVPPAEEPRVNCSTRSRSPAPDGKFWPVARMVLGHRDRRPTTWYPVCPTGRQVNVSARMPYATNCSLRRGLLRQQSRRKAALVDLVVTNHAMLAIDAMSPATILPEHDGGGRGRGHMSWSIASSRCRPTSCRRRRSRPDRPALQHSSTRTTDVPLGAGEQFGEFQRRPHG